MEANFYQNKSKNESVMPICISDHKHNEIPYWLSGSHHYILDKENLSGIDEIVDSTINHLVCRA